jgi:hypothetical protein
MKKILSFIIIALLLTPIIMIQVQAEDHLIDVSVTTIFDDENTILTDTASVEFGSKIMVDPTDEEFSNYSFAYWIVNGIVRKDLAINYQFTVTSELELIAVFHPNDEIVVLFIDSNGQLIGDAQFYNPSGPGATATEPGTLPNKPGLNVSTGVKWRLPNGDEGILTGITENTVFILQYETNEFADSYEIVINNGLGAGTYLYNTLRLVAADDDSEGSVFSHWEENGNLISRDRNYSFTVLSDRVLTAVFKESADEDLPIVSMSTDLMIREGYQTYVGQFYLPDGYELIEYGFLISDDAGMIDVETSNYSLVQNHTHHPVTNEYVMSFPFESHISIRAYAVAFDEFDNIVEFYSDLYVSYEVLNNGFETGNILGWTAYDIWKGESGMYAWQDSRAVNDTFFGSNPYNRDGSYNLGIVWSGASWDQSSERMGHLRSSDFTLGGSGWISFKLGGGRNSAFAYVSIRNAEDHTEVARFGNRHFNNTGIASTQYGSSIGNAEAFLFQYYFNLADLDNVNFGEKYYFVLTDAAAWDWSILSADSFYTFYPEEPATVEDTLAVNIVPEIEGIETATNAILSSYPFVPGITDWTNVTISGNFKTEGSPLYVRSDDGGDGVTGVLRSSAFTLDGINTYMRFEFAGGREYDKQIFITIKEVGTNIEVLRIVRRSDRAFNTGDFSEHDVDLSSLDTNKLYYVEISDNRTGGWGVIMIRNMRLRSDFNSGIAAEIVTASNPYHP